LRAIAFENDFNVEWIDEKHQPDKKWLVDVIASFTPQDEIFRKDYVPPPIRQRLKDMETIVLPDKLFEGMPQSKSKAKRRALKVMSEAFAKEKVQRLNTVKKEVAK
jgi:hypothetical protein